MVAAVLISAAVVYADMDTVAWSEPIEPMSLVELQGGAAPRRPFQQETAQPAPRDSLGIPFGSAWPQAQAPLAWPIPSQDTRDNREALVLRPGASSISLFFTALGSLGLWQFGRSARKFHVASAPDWFHTGGPIQIDHASVIDLDARDPLPPHDDQTPSDDSARASIQYALRPLPRL